MIVLHLRELLFCHKSAGKKTDLKGQCHEIFDSDSNVTTDANLDWESGFGQAKLVLKNGKKEKTYCLKSSLLSWRIFLELECPLKGFKKTYGI
jgi:hypothetical protein